jgi:hypothetical protein
LPPPPGAAIFLSKKSIVVSVTYSCRPHFAAKIGCQVPNRPISLSAKEIGVAFFLFHFAILKIGTKNENDEGLVELSHFDGIFCKELFCLEYFAAGVCLQINENRYFASKIPLKGRGEPRAVAWKSTPVRSSVSAQ